MSSISPGTLLLAVIAVMAGLLGAYVVQQNMQEPEVSAQPEAAPTEQVYTVPMASTPLKAGRKITLGDITLYRLKADQLAENGITGPFMSNTEQIIGRVLRDDMIQGATFTTNNMYPEGMGPGVADLLEPGKRAITVPVELDAAVAGFATPGTWVDVLFRSKAVDEDELPEVAVTLLERVKVLAVNEATFEGTRARGNGRSDDASVTLEVAPEEATALRVVDGRGTLALSLRHPDDEVSFSRQNPLSLDELLNIPPTQRHKMEVFRGNRLTRVDFEGTRDATTYVTRVAETEEPQEDPLEPVNSETPVEAGSASGGGQ